LGGRGNAACTWGDSRDGGARPEPRIARRLVAGAGPLIPGAANALAARTIEGGATGAGLANAYLGVPDFKALEQRYRNGP
jgi:hypothetical protein